MKNIFKNHNQNPSINNWLLSLTFLLFLSTMPATSLAHETGACDDAIEGSILYDRGSKAFIGCDGDQWVLLGTAEPKNDANTKLVLHFDGNDGSTLFKDDSSSAHTVTANGNAQIDASRNKFGGASANFDGVGDYLSITNHADFQFGSDSFTIEGWIYYNEAIGTTANRMLFSKDGGTANYNISTGIEYHCFVSFIGILTFNWNKGGSFDTVASKVSIKPNKWQHFAIVNDSANNVIKIFLDGQVVGVRKTSVTISPVAITTFRIGDNGSGNPEWIGNIDEFQISKGAARWTQNFVAPEKPHN